MNKKIFICFFGIFVFAVSMPPFVLAVARFSPGETINPNCSPADPECTVLNVRAPNSWIVPDLVARGALLSVQKGDIVTVTDIDATFVFTQDGTWQEFSKATNNVYVVPDLVARDALLNMQSGNIAVVTDSNTSFIYTQNNNWQQLLTPVTDLVPSVNGKTGNVILNSDDIVEGITNRYFTNGLSRSVLFAAAPLSYVPLTGTFSLSFSPPFILSSSSLAIDPAQLNLNDFSGVVSIAKGGTGAVNAASAILGLLPSITGNGGTFLTTDGNGLLWATVPSSNSSSTWGSISGTLADQTDLVAALSAKEPIVVPGTVTHYFRGDKTFQILNGAAVGLENVENTALSTWPGGANLTKLGTISTGIWNGTVIAVANGGTGQTGYTNGQLLIGNATGNTLTRSVLTAGNGIAITNGAGSITIANAIPVTVASSTVVATTGSTSYVVATGMTITPGAGDYLVFFTSSIANSNNGRTVFVSLFRNGTHIPSSEVRFVTASPNAASPVATSAYIAGMLAGEVIDVRWKVSGSTGTIYQRTLIMEKVK